jgi:hypothetical protein
MLPVLAAIFPAKAEAVYLFDSIWNATPAPLCDGVMVRARLVSACDD